MRDRILEIFGGPEGAPDTELARNVWPAPPPSGTNGALKSAAVLVPLVDHVAGMTVLLTRRTDHLPSHAGQISFPGGGMEVVDRSPEDTALREAEEEVGIARAHVELVGRLNAHDTGTGYRVMPVIGLLNPPLSLTPDPAEVAHIFEVPLEFVLDPVNHRFENRTRDGKEYRHRAMPFGDHHIWGLTARVLFELATILRNP